MSRTRIYAVVTARLIIIATLTLIRWAVFEPLYFVFVILQTTSETAIAWIKEFIKWAATANEQLLKDEPTTADK